MASPFGAPSTGSSASIFGAPMTTSASIFGAPVAAPAAPASSSGAQQVPVAASPFGAPTPAQVPSVVVKAGPDAPPPGVTSKAPSHTARTVPLRYHYAPTLDELTLTMSRLSAEEGVRLLDNTLLVLVRGLDVPTPGECFRRLVATTTVVKRCRLCTNMSELATFVARIAGQIADESASGVEWEESFQLLAGKK
eukprot:6457522-Amphidinium_carterae.1